jgi:L-amino acid N-acyltransferase YncA
MSEAALKLVVRPATEADVPAIASIYAVAVATGTASWELTPPSIEEMRARFRAIVDGDYPYLVAVRAGQVQGYAYASAFRPRPGYRHTIENSVYVAAAAQGQGMGRALLAELIDACAAKGWRQMVAVIGGTENVASVRLHAALGFVEVGRLPATGRKFGRWLDCIQMQRALGAGADTAPDE